MTLQTETQTMLKTYKKVFQLLNFVQYSLVMSNYTQHFKIIKAANGTKLACFFHKNSCFSNHYCEPNLINFQGRFYCCTEQIFMAEKAKMFNDKGSLQKILMSSNPQQMKLFGRKVKNYNDKLWTKRRLQIMRHINYLKFSQNAQLLKELLKTGDSLLVEASKFDKIYGSGIGLEDPRIKSPDRYPGANLFGKLLTKLRNHFKTISNRNSITM